jgi:hypothetical protein
MGDMRDRTNPVEEALRHSVCQRVLLTGDQSAPRGFPHGLWTPCGANGQALGAKAAASHAIGVSGVLRRPALYISVTGSQVMTNRRSPLSQGGETGGVISGRRGQHSPTLMSGIGDRSFPAN